MPRATASITEKVTTHKFTKGRNGTIKSDFEIIRIIVPKADEIKIAPIGDVHDKSVLANERAFENFVQKLLKEENTYTVLVGDMLNNNTRSSVGSPWEDTMRPRDAKRHMAELLKPLADSGKIIGALSGNHEKRSLKDADDDPMYDIMCKLNLEDIYRENALFIHLCIGERETKGKKRLAATYNIACHHGSGGGSLTGSGVNKAERYGYTLDNIDLLITGHTHRGAMTKPAKMRFCENSLRMIPKVFGCITVTAWQEYGGFALQKMMNPAATAIDGGEQAAYLSGDMYNKYIRLSW